MKILVFSDSHGSAYNMIKALSDHRDAEVIFHLGDGLLDLSSIPEYTENKAIFTVNGNFEDLFSRGDAQKKYETVSLCGKKFYLCHGHRVLGSYIGDDPLTPLMMQGINKNCDVVLFGHTHTKCFRTVSGSDLPVKRTRPMYLFNPGSVSNPRDGIYPSYGIIDVRDNGILFSHASIGEKR